jgi:2'-5' RNA ligase
LSKKKPNPEAPRIVRRKKFDPYEAAARRRYLYLAVPLADEVRRSIADHVRPIRDKMSSFAWFHPTRWQIVIKRFGEMERNDAEILGNAIQTAVSGPIPVEFRGLGATPDLREAQSLWVGIRDTKSGLKLLHREVNDATAALGYELEDKRFRPHLPVAVLESEQKPRPVARELSPVMDVLMSSTVLDEMVLYRTEAGRDGLVSVPFRRYPFGS